ncbi:MAG: choice-of-anchor A family protein [Kiritimatiellae bacterium]|nr:choice-of-anchor A family protein [Kiritimatiellia bacterium]
MNKKTAFSFIAAVAAAFLTVSSTLAADAFGVRSFTKYDHEASGYTVPETVNLAVVKKGSSDFVIWTRDELTGSQLTAIESYVRAKDASLQDRNAIFVSGTGSHYIDSMYGTITFAYVDDGFKVTMPRKWSHLDYGTYTTSEPEPEPEPEPNPEPGKITLTKTVNGRLWRVGCDYMHVTGQTTCDVRYFSGNAWKRDWITNPEGNTGDEGHRDNKCGDCENWVIWTDLGGVPYRMDEIKSGATGGTLPTVVYRTKAPMTDEEIANIGNPDRPECLEKYKRNFQETMPYSEIQIGQRLYWITFNGGRIWYHTGVPYEAEPSFVLTVDGVPHVLTGGQSVTIPDLEPGIHEISESESSHYSLGKIVATGGRVFQPENGWTVQIQVNAGDDIGVTWPNIQPPPKDPPTPPSPPDVPPAVTNVVTLCELMDFGKRFNAVVFGDLAVSGGDSEGALLVWGDATLPAGYSVGHAVVGDPTPASPKGNDALIVAGDLVLGPQDINGDIVYGGTYQGTNRAWSGYALRHVDPVTIDRFGNVPADGSGRTEADLLAAVRELSEKVGAWEDTGAVTNAEDGSLVLVGTNAVRNVFSVTAEQWSGSQRDWIFDVPAGSKIVVNVRGAFVEIANGQMVLPAGFTNADVLVNYVDTTFISLIGFAHRGSVLAPYASGSFTGGAIEGIAILGGDVVTKGGFEFHNFGLDVFFCPTLPEISLATTAGFASDGAIFGAAAGAVVVVTNYVSNPGEYWLRGVTLVGSDGQTVALGDLAPGATAVATTTLTSASAGRLTYSATVTASAYAAAGVAVAERPFVTASDVAVVEFVEGSCAGTVIDGAVSGEASGGASAYVPHADYGVTEMWFSCPPTFAGEAFTVNVRVANSGDADGEGAILGLYLVDVDHGATIADSEKDAAIRTVELGRIPVGQSRVYSFGGLTAPDASGVCRVIAYADVDGIQLENSKGDNQNNLTYELTQVNLQIAVSAEGVTLTWSNGWGQKYSILGSNDLENWEDVVTDIPSARDEAGLVENTYTVGFDTGYRFFKLRVDQR